VCDSNHIPMHLLGYLTERRRHHSRHNLLEDTTCDFIDFPVGWEKLAELKHPKAT